MPLQKQFSGAEHAGIVVHNEDIGFVHIHDAARVFSEQ
jgi:hypothetical protein